MPSGGAVAFPEVAECTTLPSIVVDLMLYTHNCSLSHIIQIYLLIDFEIYFIKIYKPRIPLNDLPTFI